MLSPEGELKISFGYKCNSDRSIPREVSNGYRILPGVRRTSSFSCLSGAALSANATLANTNICNGKIGEEILPSWDSPNSFRKVTSSPSLSKLDILSSSLPNSLSYLSCSPSTPSDILEHDSCMIKSASDPSRSECFLNAKEVQVAGGAAGEDRVQAVCSEENGWLFCAIYDGFNGRDAADFLAGTLYDTIISYFNKLIWEMDLGSIEVSNDEGLGGSLQYELHDSLMCHEDQSQSRFKGMNDSSHGYFAKGSPSTESKASCESFSHGVLDILQRAVSQAENDFLSMVEQEMEERPDLVSIGSCVLLVLLHGNDLYTLNLGDSRAVLAKCSTDDGINKSEKLEAIQLTDNHSVENKAERARLLAEHPDDPKVIIAGKVKGKLKVTRAFGVGYLKKKNLNDALMGILRVRDLTSPPYVSTEPSLNVHKISHSDQFVIVGSDGLFDFFSNDEAVKLVESYILNNSLGDPAKFLIEQLVARAAKSAGFSMEELMNVPAGRRRKYHDDVTVIVIMLGINQRTSKASTGI
ncbi:probable protein phosphatase 2C 40 isoform X2 [Abrus precatorius]|nr:probable protein phosphatase 2C 40 isoform X2 [Abrus precatorius]XP_027330261.1 probable protein phosphatase 2C 40 isoform X2 [Abrus precatorius]XP_027330262.1 probable protein phosphatase 2C 40 isoform X2 [Abrus precatorius]